MTRQHKQKSSPKRPKAVPPTKAAPEAEPKTGFYDSRYSAEEVALLSACLEDPGLDPELWLQRVLNRRLLGAATGLGNPAPGEAVAPSAGAAPVAAEAPAPSALDPESTGTQNEERAALLARLVNVANALTSGTGRVARLLRDQRVLSGEAVDSLADALATALVELGKELGVQL